MDEAETTRAYGGSWYAATKVDAPQRPRIDGRPRRRCLRDRRRARGPDDGARGGPGRLVRRAHRGRPHCGERFGPQYRIRASGLRRRSGQAHRPRRLCAGQGSLGAVAERARICPQYHPRRRHAAGSSSRTAGFMSPRPTMATRSCTSSGSLASSACEIEGWPTERVRAVLRSERYFHAIHYPRAINIHPLNYALGLAAAAERAGARIFEHTPALSIDPAGVRKRIVTPSARLRANHVVLCGNVQIAALVPQIAAALIPITTYVITTAPLGPRLAEAIGYRGAVSDSDLADNHYRIVDGDRLMWSGRATTWARNPRRYLRALTADIKKTYPQLGEVTVDYAWSGTLGNSIHRMPQIGELGARRVARERLRRPWSQYDRDRRQPHCPRHRRGRSHLEAIHAVRARLGGRPVRPRGHADVLLDEARRRCHRRAPRPRRRHGAPPRPRSRSRDGRTRAAISRQSGTRRHRTTPKSIVPPPAAIETMGQSGGAATTLAVDSAASREAAAKEPKPERCVRLG